MSAKNLYQILYEFLFYDITLIIRPRTFALCFSFLILISSKTLPQLEKEKIDKEISEEKNQSNFNEEYDSYMVIYFKEDCNYTTGFKNKNRYDI